jgi:hypothetical protein
MSGLERRRGCGRLEAVEKQPEVVWARRGVSVSTCPTSYISGGSLALIEEYGAWKAFGHGDYRHLPARLVDAVCVLEKEMAGERNHVEN